jgi:hypothetical protein
MIVRSGTEESDDERIQTIAPKGIRAKLGKRSKMLQNGVFDVVLSSGPESPELPELLELMDLYTKKSR